MTQQHDKVHLLRFANKLIKLSSTVKDTLARNLATYFTVLRCITSDKFEYYAAKLNEN